MKLANYNLTDIETGEEYGFEDVDEAIPFDDERFGKDEQERKEKRILAVKCKCEKCGCVCHGNISTQDSFQRNYGIDDLCPHCDTMNLKEI